MKPSLTAVAALLGSSLIAIAVAADPGGTVTPTFRQAIPNIPGKSLVAVTVDYPPAGKTPAHRHAPSAFIFGYVIEGEIRSQVDDEPARVYKKGESFHEVPGAHHRVSENASGSMPAKLLAVFVVDSNEKELTTLDAK
jgi:quercetin dioxygenase-like cupin family protein